MTGPEDRREHGMSRGLHWGRESGRRPPTAGRHSRPGRSRRLSPGGSRIFAALFFCAGALARAAIAAQPAARDSTATPPGKPGRIEDIESSQPIPLHPTLPLFLHVQAQPPPPRAFTAADEQELLAGLAGPQEGGDDEFRPEAPETSIELALAPYSWSVPDISQKILRQRQINDVVVLQCLIDPTGKVQRVRVLRGIPNCPECTKSARAAAQKFVYRAPPRQPNIKEVWTTPFEMRFTAGKRVRVRR